MIDIPEEYFSHPSLSEYLATYLTPARIKAIDKVLSQRTKYGTVVLEDTFKAHNTSAVVRSCDCFGFQDLYFIESHFPFKVSRGISKGAFKWVNVHRFPTVGTTFKHLKKKGYKIAGTILTDSAIPISELPLDQPVTIVFGTEQYGLTDFAADECDYHVKIPMYGFTESFNISVSAALIMNELRRRMTEENINWQLSPEDYHRAKFEWMYKSIRNVEHIAARYVKENPVNESI